MRRNEQLFGYQPQPLLGNDVGISGLHKVRELQVGDEDQLIEYKSLLTGLLFDEAGERLTPTWSVKKGTRYRYYVSTSLVKDDGRIRSTRRRIPAGNLENVVIERLRKFLSSRGELLDAIEGKSLGRNGQGQLMQRGRQIADELSQTPDQNKAIVAALVRRVEVGSDIIKVEASQGRLTALLSSDSRHGPTMSRSMRPIMF